MRLVPSQPVASIQRRQKSLVRRAQRAQAILWRRPAVSNLSPPRRGRAAAPARRPPSPPRSKAAPSRDRERRSAPGPRRTRRRAAGSRRRAAAGRRRHRRPAPSPPPPPAAPPSETSWQAATVPARICARTKSPLRRSAAEIDRRRRAVLAAGDFAQPKRLAEMPVGGADQHEVEPARQGDADRLRRILQHAEAADRRGRQDRPALGLVVEADIAADDREIERVAGRRHAADGGGELAHDLGLLRDCRNSCCR